MPDRDVIMYISVMYYITWRMRKNKEDTSNLINEPETGT